LDLLANDECDNWLNKFGESEKPEVKILKHGPPIPEKFALRKKIADNKAKYKAILQEYKANE